ncbi:Gfo/Idh/MocA family protein [Spelaeicoccus albus]|uniref:Putative dehydrogenase n=1 Tax=Spelaeicoccus albus TaxID=1280376 RepID=A0A7Z0D1Z8_9MICO|nr:Gfo/Idh/MocA family oxidoreductase [Spelaeicoccus albus]NYI67317.1 putative dehydrogenase [Spelaeicoccus albus]
MTGIPNTKIGIMSFAHHHAAGYAAVLREMTGVEVRAADPSTDEADAAGGEKRGRELAADLGIDYAETYGELLAWKPDGVIIATENSRHLDAIRLAAGAGAQILCEKPLATTVHDARAAREICNGAGVNLMVAFPVRFNPDFSDLRSAVDAGRLGDIVAVSGTNNGRIPIDTRRWFIDKELAGGGAIIDHTVHIADLVDALFGLAPVRVHAVANHLFGEHEVETGGVVTIDYEDGLIATIDCSWSRPRHYPTWGGLTMHVTGTGGLAALDAFAARVEGFTESGRRPVWLPFGTDVNSLMLAEFVSAVREGRVAEPGFGSGIRTTQIVEAAYLSVQSGQPVAVA